MDYHPALGVRNSVPVIGYWNGNNGDQLYVQAVDAKGDTWDTPRIVEGTANYSSYSSMVFIGGIPHIAYRDNISYDLRYATLGY